MFIKKVSSQRATNMNHKGRKELPQMPGPRVRRSSVETTLPPARPAALSLQTCPLPCPKHLERLLTGDHLLILPAPFPHKRPQPVPQLVSEPSTTNTLQRARGGEEADGARRKRQFVRGSPP